MTATQTVLNALRDRGCRVTGGGRQWTAQCPAHEDRNPSLAITTGESRVLLRCHAGCDTDDVLDALGLSRRDLFDEPRRRTHDHARSTEKLSRVVAEYVYTDEHGEPLYVKERLDPKSFRQKLPDGSYRLNGVRKVLYRLPEVIAAVAAGDTIYVVEGEKDADALAAVGVVATCNAEGAAGAGQRPKWRPEYGDTLAGANVVVVADKDAAGYAHARAIVADLTGKASSVRVVQSATAGDKDDVSDHLDAGFALDQLLPVDLDRATTGEPETAEHGRRLLLTPASGITPKRVRWAWQGRMAQGTLSLVGGREGTGKSTFCYHLAARLTRGQLHGEHHGNPRSVLVCATEDSWSHTIVPRLIAAGADLDRIFRAEIVSADEVHVGLNLPRDIARVESAVEQVNAAMLLLDPLMSRIDARLDTHRDGELRQALEPIAALADRTGLLVVGLIHFNKTGSTDVLDRIMGSKAFVAVARSVSAVVVDPDDETGRRRLFGTVKNNLGRDDLPSLGFTIEDFELTTDDGPTHVGRIVLGDQTDTSVHEAMQRAAEDPDVRTATGDAKDWLHEYLTEHGGSADSADVKAAAAKAGHAERTLHKARKALHVTSQSVPGVMPRRTTWVLPVGPPSRAASPWGDYITDTTGIDAGQSVTTSDDGTTSRAYRACAAVPPREAAQQLPDGECPDCCEPVDGPPDATCQVPRVHRVRVLA